GVEEAIVLVCPDDIRLQAPVVVIKGYVDVDSIKRFVREHLGPIAEPREIVVVNAITDVLLDDMKKNYCNPT
ncbi:MAG: AMP-binding enzyme, partial [Acidilobaceae archaeon]